MDTQSKSWLTLLQMIISGSLFLGIVVTVICDMAITGGLSWSWYPIVSIVFTWLVIIPILYFRKHRIFFSLLIFSVLIIPYLMALNEIIGVEKLMLPLAIPITVIAMIYIWSIYILFSIKSIRIWYSLAIIVLLSIPVSMGVDYVIYNVLSEPAMQIWDVLSYVMVACLGMYLLLIGRRRSRYAS